MGKHKVLFLCTRNSCRSQMAEGWARHIHGARLEAYSAGTQPGVLDPLAVEVMAEAGVDISGQRPKHVDELGEERFDYVVTLCEGAGACPFFPGAKATLHAPFEDPPALAAGAASKDEALAHYRRVRDEIRDYVRNLPELFEKEQ